MATNNNSSVIELATIKLAEGKSEADLVTASAAFQRDFLAKQPGVLRRQLVRKSTGEYLDIVHWRSSADADAVMQLAQSSPEVGAYFSVMAFDSENPEEGVEHCSLIAAYE